MRKKGNMRALVALLLIAALLSGSALAASYGAKILPGGTGVYRTAGGKRVGKLSSGTSIVVKKVSGSWAKISYSGRNGYAPLKNIEFNSHIKAKSTRATSIRFMTRASYSKGKYYTGTLAKGVTIYLAGINGSYYLFYDRTGNTVGYISKSAVRRVK